MELNKLALYIKENREKKGYSQRELAKELNISNSELSRIEKGERQKPDIDILSKIANVLDLSLQDLLSMAGYDQFLLLLGFKSKHNKTKSIVDYERDIKEYERFYYDILDDSSKKKDNVRQQQEKLAHVLDKYEMSQVTKGAIHAPTYEELMEVIKDVFEGLQLSAEKYDYSKLPKVQNVR